MYKINEIFYSLQGEGANTGMPAVFIRFAGCNLKCPFCDTDFSDFSEMTISEILQAISEYPSDFIILTGGEPALQIDQQLINALHDCDKIIAIETNGTKPLPQDIDWVTVSPKEGSKLAITQADEVKVVFTGQDVEQYMNIEAESYYLQPCSIEKNGVRTDNLQQVIQYCLQNPHWSLSIQTHKLLNFK